MNIQFINGWKPTLRYGEFNYYYFPLVGMSIGSYDTGRSFNVSLAGFEVKMWFPRKAAA